MATNCSGGNADETLYAQKLKECMNCDFYKQAFREEFGKPTFKSASTISELLLFSPSI